MRDQDFAHDTGGDADELSARLPGRLLLVDQP
jgi:hypothetical protein